MKEETREEEDPMILDGRICEEYKEAAGRPMTDGDLAALYRLCDQFDINLEENSYQEAKEKLIASFTCLCEDLSQEVEEMEEEE